MATRKQQSNARRDLVAGEILEKAAALFADRGFSSTSLQDVAEALDISRTALYHYIGGKDELLTQLVRGLTSETAKSLEGIAADESLDAIGKVEAAVRSMAERVAKNPARFRLLLMSEGSLSDPLAREHKAARRRARDALVAIVAEGVRSGSLRSVDERSAAFALIGMCNWIAWWYRPEAGSPPPEKVAEEISEMGIASLRADAARSPQSGASGVEHAIDLLRRDLDQLQRALTHPPSG